MVINHHVVQLDLAAIRAILKIILNIIIIIISIMLPNHHTHYFLPSWTWLTSRLLPLGGSSMLAERKSTRWRMWEPSFFHRLSSRHSLIVWLHDYHCDNQCRVGRANHHTWKQSIESNQNMFYQNRKLMPKFVLKDMEGLYIEEMNTAINTLKVW